MQQRVVGRSPSKLYQKVRFEHYALSSANTIIAMSATETWETGASGEKAVCELKKKTSQGPLHDL